MKLTGRLKVGNRIVIPEEVNPDSIVVHLTPHRVWQELYVSSVDYGKYINCLLYTSPSPRDVEESRMPGCA